MRRLALALCFIGLVSLVWGCGLYRESRARARFPHVVLVSLDTLHVNRTGAYNPEVDTTPFLERFAGEGVRFDRAYTPTPITLPSHAALMTGVSPPTLGVMANGDLVPESAITLAEILGDAGYRTAAFPSLGVLQPTFGLHQGFDDFHDPFGEGPVRWYRRANEIYDSIEAWLRDHHDEPFFLWVHFSDPHEPYVPPDAPPDTELWLDDELVGTYNIASAESYAVRVEVPVGAHRLRWTSLREPHEDDRPETAVELLMLSPDAFAGLNDKLPTFDEPIPLRPSFSIPVENKKDNPVSIELIFSGRLQRPPPSVVLPSYDANVAHADRHLEALDGVLETLGIRDETLVAIVSDHGEGLFSHNVLGHAAHVYEDQNRILWMMRGPTLPEGFVIEDRPALITDVAPTILELLGLPRGGMEGRSWVSCWSSHACPETEPFWTYGISHETRGLTGMASYRWPYKWMWRRGFKRVAYEVASDPWEKIDLLENPGPHNPTPLKKSAESFRAERRRLSRVLHETRDHEEASETQKLLESLGYLGGAKADPEKN